MFPGAKVIAVDDDEDQLARLLTSLRALGIACLSYNYPNEAPDDTPDSSGLRILFLDINLIGGASPDQDANVFNAPISLIDRLVSMENGPYALITWSSTGLHQRLIDRIDQTDALKEKRPFYSRALSKTEYAEQPEKLKEEIQRIFSENASFGALLDWERRVAKAGEAVLRDVYEFSREFPGDNGSEKMDRMLSKLAVDAFGKHHVEQHRFEAVNEALMPILGDALNAQFLAGPSDELWRGAITKHDEHCPVDERIVSKLNTAVMFEASQETKPYRRGAVLKLPESWCEDEEFERRFGARSSRVRGEILKLDQPKKPQWVLIQAQAACDFAQMRLGPIPYLLAAVIPADHARKKDGSGKQLALPATVWQSPLLTGTDSVCETDFRFEIIHGIACQLTRKAIEEARFEVLGRLKDPIVETISYEYHSHGSRPGFVSFR